MGQQKSNPVIDNVRRALGQQASMPVGERPPILPPRVALPMDEEIDLLIDEINKLSGNAQRMRASDFEAGLRDLVKAQDIKKATLWRSAGLADLQVEERLKNLAVEVISPNAEKHVLAECDLGITGADFALPETGTLGLLSSPEQPRAVSLLPRVHLALVRPTALRADLQQVFSEAKKEGYLVFITGPSRTADIELTVTLGVHGPKSLYVWVVS